MVHDAVGQGKWLDGKLGFHGETEQKAWKVEDPREWLEIECQKALSSVIVRLLKSVWYPLHITGVLADFLLDSTRRWIISLVDDRSRYNYSVIGCLEPRLELLNDLQPRVGDRASPRLPPQLPGFVEKKFVTREFLDLAIMASKLAYEEENVQSYTVTKIWEMSYYKFYDCINFYHDPKGDNTTQAFIFTDKPTDANMIFLAFRGTEPFNAIDWSTDVDIPCLPVHEINGVTMEGCLHVGFLEALGLGNKNEDHASEERKNKIISELKEPSVFDEKALPKDKERLAFYVITHDLLKLIAKHPKANLYVSGHSLGGALALTFVSILVLTTHKSAKIPTILDRLFGVYTFGQPRIANKLFCTSLEKKMEEFDIDYYRVVYCNDVVCRVPFDHGHGGYRHAGHTCRYYDSMFDEKDLVEAPNANFFSLLFYVPMRVTAAWELIQGQIGQFIHGENFQEGILNVSQRIVGLVLPGISAHLPTNYVNAIRVGPPLLFKNHADYSPSFRGSKTAGALDNGF